MDIRHQNILRKEQQGAKLLPIVQLRKLNSPHTFLFERTSSWSTSQNLFIKFPKSDDPYKRFDMNHNELIGEESCKYFELPTLDRRPIGVGNQESAIIMETITGDLEQRPIDEIGSFDLYSFTKIEVCLSLLGATDHNIGAGRNFGVTSVSTPNVVLLGFEGIASAEVPNQNYLENLYTAQFPKHKPFLENLLRKLEKFPTQRIVLKSFYEIFKHANLALLDPFILHRNAENKIITLERRKQQSIVLFNKKLSETPFISK